MNNSRALVYALPESRRLVRTQRGNRPLSGARLHDVVVV